MSVGFNLPINKYFTIQPMYTSGSIKGKFVNGYFANEISISQVNLVYNLFLPEIIKLEHKLLFKTGMGILKSNNLVFNELTKTFRTISYPFFSYYLGIDYAININPDITLNLNLDCHLTETEWLDGNPTRSNDIILTPRIGLAYNLTPNKKTKDIKQPTVTNFNDKGNSIDYQMKEELKDFIELNLNGFKKQIDERLDSTNIKLLDQTKFNYESSYTDNAKVNQNYLDTTISVTMPNSNIRQVKITPPSYRYNVICGAYTNLDKVIFFSDILKKLGHDAKVIKTQKSNLYLVSIYEGSEYGKTRANMSILRSKLEKLNIQGNLWIWDKVKGRGN